MPTDPLNLSWNSPQTWEYKSLFEISWEDPGLSSQSVADTPSLNLMVGKWKTAWFVFPNEHCWLQLLSTVRSQELGLTQSSYCIAKILRTKSVLSSKSWWIYIFWKNNKIINYWTPEQAWESPPGLVTIWCNWFISSLKLIQTSH